VRILVSSAWPRFPIAPPAPITVNEWAERWLADQITRLDPLTFTARKNFIRDKVASLFGSKAIAQVVPADVTQVLQNSVESGVAPNTLRQHYFVLNAIFRDARQARFISVNPCAAVSVPRRQKVANFPWNADNLRTQIGLLEQHKMRNSARLALGTALRPVELYHGCITDYDPSGPWFIVAYRSRYAIAPRKLALPQFAVDSIDELIAQSRARQTPLLVSTDSGKPFTRYWFSESYHDSFSTAQEVPSRKFWELRAAFEYLARSAGMKHSTLDYYMKVRTGCPAPSDAELLLAAEQLHSAFLEITTDIPRRSRRARKFIVRC